MTSSEKLDVVLKDYSETIGLMLLHIKTMGLNYLADGIEMAWKFIIVSLDRVLGVRDAELKKKNVDRVY